MTALLIATSTLTANPVTPTSSVGLVSISATVEAVPVSPTVTPTFTAREKEIYNKGWEAGRDRQYCATICRFYLQEFDEYQKDYHLGPYKKKNQGLEESIGDSVIVEEAARAADNLFGEDRYGSKKSIQDWKKKLKKNHCNCNDFKEQ